MNKHSTLIAGLAVGLLICVVDAQVQQGPGGGVEPPQSTVTYSSSTSSNTTFQDTPVQLVARGYEVRVQALLRSRSAGNTVVAFDEQVTDDLTLARSAEALEDARQSLVSRAGAETLDVLPANQTLGAIAATNSTPTTVEVGRTVVETVILEDVLGPNFTIIGNRDTGGTPLFVLNGTINTNFDLHTDTTITREVRTTTTTTKTVEYEVVGLVP